jgi:polysaccharide pyruvyl transferase CsaB
MHVVMSGYYGFDNVGDEAILYSIIQALKKVDPSIKITVLSNNPEYTKKTYDVGAVNRWKLKEVSAVLKEADGLISGGGSLLQDQTGMKSIPYYTGIMKIAQWNKKPVFIYAQGMGPINKGISKLIVKKVLEKAHVVTVRDEDSKQLLREIGVKKTIDIVPDPVIGLEPSTFTSPWLESQNLQSFITVSVRDWPSTVDYKQKIARSLDKLATKGYQIVFLPMHGEHDDKTSNEIAKMMSQKSTIAPFDASIKEKIAIIGRSDLLIGMRLHSLIFAAITNIPFISISYDPKIDAFSSICSQPVIGHVTEDNWTDEILTNVATEKIQNQQEEKSRLEKIVRPLQTKALSNAKKALDTFS